MGVFFQSTFQGVNVETQYVKTPPVMSACIIGRVGVPDVPILILLIHLRRHRLMSQSCCHMRDLLYLNMRNSKRRTSLL